MIFLMNNSCRSDKHFLQRVIVQFKLQRLLACCTYTFECVEEDCRTVKRQVYEIYLCELSAGRI